MFIFWDKRDDPQWWRKIMDMKPIPNYPNHSHADVIKANCESGVHRGCGCSRDKSK